MQTTFRSELNGRDYLIAIIGDRIHIEWDDPTYGKAIDIDPIDMFRAKPPSYLPKDLIDYVMKITNPKLLQLL